MEGRKRPRDPEARTHRPVGCNLAVQSRPQAVFLAALTLAGRSQGVPGQEKFVEEEGPAFVIVPRNRPKPGPIDGIRSFVFGAEPIYEPEAEKIKWGYRCIAKGAFLTLVPRRGSDISRSVNEFFQRKYILTMRRERIRIESMTRSAGLIFVARLYIYWQDVCVCVCVSTFRFVEGKKRKRNGRERGLDRSPLHYLARDTCTVNGMVIPEVEPSVNRD